MNNRIAHVLVDIVHQVTFHSIVTSALNYVVAQIYVIQFLYSLVSKSMFNIPLYSRMVLPSLTESSTTTTLTTTTIQVNATKAAPDYFIGEERTVEDDDEMVPALDVNDLNSHEEFNLQLPELSVNKTITWDYLPQDKDYNNGVASISNLVLFLIPLLFVLLF
ncbi:unnamed protein product [Adineta ricciae]|uniref:Uncharacterized protein n=1 Tax=Adineta ricciae TaxID=249248 RepID=A0A814JKE2_ADIRI|nr:unnamed protein product [Adineta ricciae]